MKKVSNGMKTRRIITNAFIYLILAIVSVLWLFPFFYIIIQSVRGDSTGISLSMFPSLDNPNAYTFQNYVLLLTDTSNNANFLRWYFNTLIIAIVTAAAQTILVLMTSYTLSRLRFKGRKALMKLILIIGMFPGFLSMIAIYKILQAIGLQTSVFGLILVYISGSASGYYISKGFFDTISKSLDEAAMIDGASKKTIFWKIIIPLAKPIVVYTILTSFIGPWGDFMLANYIVGGSASEYYTVAVGLQKWLTPSNSALFFTRFCAGAVFVSIPIVILFFILQRYYVEGVTGGAVKG